jgi:hypothetical protein
MPLSVVDMLHSLEARIDGRLAVRSVSIALYDNVHIKMPTNRKVKVKHIILDNSGSESCHDLALLRASRNNQTYHFKIQIPESSYCP